MQIETDLVAMTRSTRAVSWAWAVLVCMTTLGACSNAPLPSLTTGSLFGSKPDAQAATSVAAVPSIKNDPTTRTLQVSRVAAKAQRCGFNFDPVKLKANFMAAEGAQGGVDVAELSKLDQVYNGSFKGTLKSVKADESYCSELRTAHVKGDLNRHLAGDFAPGTPFKDPNADDDGGLFSGSGGIFDSSGSTAAYKGPTLPTDNR
jgi:hypothetical protein